MKKINTLAKIMAISAAFPVLVYAELTHGINRQISATTQSIHAAAVSKKAVAEKTFADINSGNFPMMMNIY